MTKMTNSSVKKHCESTEPKSHQIARILFFLSSSSDGLVQIAWLFTMIFSSISNWAAYDPIAFHNFEVSWGAWNQSFKIYGFICNAIFCICMHAHKALSNEA